MSLKRGNPVNVYEKDSTPVGGGVRGPSGSPDSGEFSLIGSFVSTRKAANFLNISPGTVTKYMQSGTLFKDKYKFSTR